MRCCVQLAHHAPVNKRPEKSQLSIKQGIYHIFERADDSVTKHSITKLIATMRERLDEAFGCTLRDCVSVYRNHDFCPNSTRAKDPRLLTRERLPSHAPSSGVPSCPIKRNIHIHHIASYATHPAPIVASPQPWAAHQAGSPSSSSS